MLGVVLVRAIAFAQAPHFVDEAGGEHRVEALGDAPVERLAIVGSERERAQLERQRRPRAGSAMR